MASSSGGSYTSSQETTNFARICRIVVDVLRDILWQVLIREIPAADLPSRVQMNQKKLGKLDATINTWLCGISPSSTEIPIAEKFDVTSLYTLIRNLCSQVPAPSTQWGKTPPPGGTTLGDDIERVREFRNTQYGHATRANIDTADFNKLCSDIKSVVSRFDAYFSSTAMKCDFKSEMDFILTCSMDKLLQDTYIDKMKEIAVLSGDVENVKQQFGNVMQQVGDLKWEVGVARQEVGIIKSDADDVKQEVHELKEEVGDVRQEVDDVRQEVGDLNEEVGDLNEEVVDVKLEVHDVKHDVGDVMQTVDGLKQEVSDAKQGVVTVKHDVSDVKQEVSSLQHEVGSLKEDIDDVKKEAGELKQELYDVNQDVGNVVQKCGSIMQQVGYFKEEVGIARQEVGIIKHDVDDVRQEVGELKQEVGDVRQEVYDVKQDVGNVMLQVDGLKVEVSDAKQDIVDVKDDFKQEVSGLQNQVGSVKQDVDELKQEVGDVKQDVDDVMQDIFNVKHQVIDFKEEVSITRQEVGILKHDIEDVKQAVGDVNEEVVDIKQEVHVVKHDVGDVMQAVGDLNEEVVDIKQEVHVVKHDVGDVKLAVGDLNEEVVDIKQEVHVVKHDVGDVKQAVGELNKEVVDIKEEVHDVKHDVGDVMQKVGKVMQQVDALKQEVGDVKQQQVGGLKQEVGDVKQKGESVAKDIAEVKETVKKKHDVLAKEDMQTKQKITSIWRCICCPCFHSQNSNRGYQLVSGDEISLQSFQDGKQMSTDEMEVTQVVESYNDPEAGTQVIPAEILQMNEESIQMFKEALRDRTEKVYNIRVLIVGQFSVGKTTLCKRLLGDDVNIDERKSTEGIEVHIHRCRVSHATGEWLKLDKDGEQSNKLQRFCKLLSDQGQVPDIEQVENSKVMHQMKTSDVEENEIQHMELRNFGADQISIMQSSSNSLNVFDEDSSRNDVKEPRLGTDQMRGQSSSSKSSEDQNSVEDDDDAKARSKALPGDTNESFSNISYEEMLEQSLKVADKSISNDAVKNILQFLNENADKLVRSREEYSPLAMWDFAGQYIYYTTHQTFLTQRAIYLLVIDLTQHLTDDVMDDDFFFDIEGKRQCQVHELAELWLNSIHSCAPFLESGSPPVILVGTHADKIKEDNRQETCENVFRHIRYHYLKGRPAIFHLADEDFSIDNTIVDPKIKDLQKKIVELAFKQKHWGETIPARWLLLEELLMGLKTNDVKVIPYHLLEKMNQEGDVKIESKQELDLFLKFQHDIGNILYFSTNEQLRESIVLEPQWLIKAVKTLITAEMFILRKHPETSKYWRKFKEEGKLTQKLLDVIWSKEHDADLYHNKKLILLLMEHLNIIARPRMFTKDGVTTEDFFLAPCMLQQTSPREVISPKVKAEMKRSSVLCFVFKGKFLPSPIFHRLLAVCVAEWPILRKRGINQIYCGCGVFEIDRLHRLTLYFKSYVIFARVTLAAGAKHQELDANVCTPVREFINVSLSKILGTLSQNLKFELFMQCQCPDSVGDCLDSMLSVEVLKNSSLLTCCYHDDNPVESYSLLKYWFRNEEYFSLQRSELEQQQPVTFNELNVYFPDD